MGTSSCASCADEHVIAADNVPANHDAEDDCTQCSAQGMHFADLEQGECINCRDQGVPLGYNRTSGKCYACPDGYEWVVGTEADRRPSCETCAPGKAQATADGTGLPTCNECPSGEFSGKGATNCTQCGMDTTKLF